MRRACADGERAGGYREVEVRQPPRLACENSGGLPLLCGDSLAQCGRQWRVRLPAVGNPVLQHLAFDKALLKPAPLIVLSGQLARQEDGGHRGTTRVSGVVGLQIRFAGRQSLKIPLQPVMTYPPPQHFRERPDGEDRDSSSKPPHSAGMVWMCRVGNDSDSQSHEAHCPVADSPR